MAGVLHQPRSTQDGRNGRGSCGLLLSGADAAAQEGEGGLMRFSEESLAASVAAFQATMAGASTSCIPRPAPSLLYFGDVAAGPGGFSECAPGCPGMPRMAIGWPIG